MDIFLRNIADSTSEKSLKKFLRKRLLAFTIDTFDVYKLPKTRGCAIVTVLDEINGHRFIEHYGINRLDLHRRIYVGVSRDPPDPHKLKTLEKRRKDLAKARGKSMSQAQTGPNQYPTKYVLCGVWECHDNQIVFVPHYQRTDAGFIVTGEKSLSIAIPMIQGLSTGNIVPVHRLDVTYSTIESAAVGSTPYPFLALTLSVAPRVYFLEPDYEYNQRMRNAGQLRSQRYRKPVRIHGFDNEHTQVMGRAFVYHITFAEAAFLSGVHAKLKHKASFPTLSKAHTSIRIPLKSLASEMGALLSSFNKGNNQDLPFSLKFQLQRLAQNGYLQPTTVMYLLPHIHAVSNQHGEHAATSAIKLLFRQIPFMAADADPGQFSIDNLVAKLRSNATDYTTDTKHELIGRHKNLILVHKVSITPSGTYLEGPDVESKNRVLRKYSDFASTHFVRVTFMDEDGTSIRFDRNGSLERVHYGFKQFLRDPLEIAGRKFYFLGFSNSSLREQGCWYLSPFYHEDNEFVLRDNLIEGLGDFTSIRCPAKCAARIGQAFTDTPYGTTPISPHAVRIIPDVERGDRVFSDGCGTVSYAVVKELWKNYSTGRRPTVFQIRQGGAKGMVSLDTRLTGTQLNLRPSMNKFIAHTDIEICDAARRPLPFYLNRQIIKVLEDLGVSTENFLNLQNEAVEDLRKTTQHAINAAQFLRRNDVGRATQLDVLLKELHYIGISSLDDNFLRQCLEHTILGYLRMLKHKARIPIKQGVTLFGIMDETGVLCENEIFCKKEGKVHTQKSLAITRSPALHPGDVQLVTAVPVPDNSPLHKLNNVVVFSQHGERDLASKLSGGDLDGDIFNLIFEARLQPTQTCSPADYPRVPTTDIGRNVRVEDITDFFVDFMANDQLGRIANMHLQAADQQEVGTHSSDCITLAGLHSTAVDFQKSGISVNMGECPRVRPFKPDFMAPGPRLLKDVDHKLILESNDVDVSDDEDRPENAFHADKMMRRVRYYESSKALGNLYRAIDEEAFLEELQRAPSKATGLGVMQQLWKYVEKHTRHMQWTHLSPWAEGIKQEYEELIYELQYSYGSRRHPLTEVEVFTGSILGNEDEGLPSRRLKETAKSMKEVFEEAVSDLIQRMKYGSTDSLDDESDYDEDFAGEEDESEAVPVPSDEALERSIACFSVSLKDDFDRPANQRLVSFRYIAGVVCLRQVNTFVTALSGIELDIQSLHLGR